MTYADAVRTLDEAYRGGSRDIRVPREVFKAYHDGVPALERYGPPMPPPLEPMLMFRDAEVKIMR
jgi:hypothetical protein